jgi:alpha-1,2-mannosyltransferase
VARRLLNRESGARASALIGRVHPWSGWCATSRKDQAAMPRLSVLAEARWLDAARARAYGRVLLAMTLVIAVLWVATSRGGVDRMGHPLGTDFLSFWAASSLALSGRAADVYDPMAHGQLEQTLFPAYTQDGYTAFFYPPTYLLLCLPLALLPYFWSLAAWLGLTLLAYWRGLRALLPGPGLALPILAYPAVLITAGHGQNALLTTALFAGAAHWLARRPLLAGMCLGALCIKPHFLVLVPVALLAGRHVRASAGAALGAAALSALSLLVFGADTWLGFLRIAPLAQKTLEQGLVEPGRMASVFAALRLLAAPVPVAYAAQIAVALAAAAVLVRACREADAAGQVAALVAATLLASPFLLDYDMTLAAVPLAWVLSRAQASGFLRWEKITLAAAFVLPLLDRVLAVRWGLPVAPLVDAAVLAVVARRIRAR